MTNYFPIIAALVIGFGIVLYNATMYHNPLTSTDVGLAIGTATAVWGFVQTSLKMQPPKE